MAETVADTRRLITKPQNLNDAYGPPSNFLEIDVSNPLPGKAFLRQLPFRGDDGIFDDNFIEERKQGLEQFINKVAGHPLAQNERCLHMFLQDEIIDKSYTPSKIRHA
uniref:Sorting nexin 3 n=1 Tax=Myotis myotis TaxID=51298 RepID=A0A7J7WXD4_MYOMY|nr:sorting nexin 3 [Myotis myotis]